MHATALLLGDQTFHIQDCEVAATPSSVLYFLLPFTMGGNFDFGEPDRIGVNSGMGNALESNLIVEADRAGTLCDNSTLFHLAGGSFVFTIL